MQYFLRIKPTISQLFVTKKPRFHGYENGALYSLLVVY
jgi:hypothetical protein